MTLTFEEAKRLAIGKWEIVQDLNTFLDLDEKIYNNPKFKEFTAGCALCEYYDDDCSRCVLAKYVRSTRCKDAKTCLLDMNNDTSCCNCVGNSYKKWLQLIKIDIKTEEQFKEIKQLAAEILDNIRQLVENN